MLRLSDLIILGLLSTLIISTIGQKVCEDFGADPNNCTKFIRCFQNVRIKFTCPEGTAWEDSLKTCVSVQQVEACKRIQQRKLDPATEAITFDADINALDDIPVSATLAEARALGPIVTPKQYRCTFCATGLCGIIVNTIQCVCGNNQCQPPTTTTTTTVQPRNPCADNPCLNGGQCIPVNGGGFICNCPETHTGNRCEAPVPTPCQPNPCQNGGICTPQGTSFTCRCPSTFTGYCCETRVTTTTPFNPCAQSACQNGGQCIPSGNTYFCQCPNGYYGTRCENRDWCVPNPCANNGACTLTTTGYICSCTYPYTGPTCQQIITTTTTTTTTTTVATRAPCGGGCACIITPCPFIVVTNPCQPNPCQNMGGCAVQNNAARCWCPNNYQGYYCQFGRNARSLASKPCNKTCYNGGQCYIDEQRRGEARCSCSNEYYGSQCEFVNGPKSCAPKNPCMNNGKCVSKGTFAKCVCQTGTSGILCERIAKAKNAKYCPLDCQANGTCVYVASTPKCRCPPGRTGRLCELHSA